MQSKETQTLVLNLEKWRVQKGMSQAEMAKSINLSISTYSRLISGETNNLSADTIRAIYKTTGRMCFELMECDDDEYLRLVKLCHNLNEKELRYFLHTIQDFILLKRGNI